MAGALRGADKRPAPRAPGQNERVLSQAHAPPAPLEHPDPGHPAAGPGTGPRSWLAGLSPAGLLDSPAEESQVIVAAARTPPPQVIFDSLDGRAAARPC
jgi:hypothetical protein